MTTMMIATTMSNITSEPLPPDSIRKHKPFHTVHSTHFACTSWPLCSPAAQVVMGECGRPDHRVRTWDHQAEVGRELVEHVTFTSPPTPLGPAARKPALSFVISTLG